MDRDISVVRLWMRGTAGSIGAGAFFLAPRFLLSSISEVDLYCTSMLRNSTGTAMVGFILLPGALLSMMEMAEMAASHVSSWVTSWVIWICARGKGGCGSYLGLGLIETGHCSRG